MSSVNNYLRKQVDANNFSSSASNQSSFEVDQRPLSEYDNLQNITTTSSSNSNNNNNNTLQTHFPLADIKFHFDDFPSSTGMSSSMQNSNSNNHNNAITSIPSHRPQYENVIDTLQMRDDDNSFENIEQIDGHVLSPNHRPAISEAKSSFFGIHMQSTVKNDDMEMLIEDHRDIRIISDEVQYVNLNNENDDKGQVSATSSASGSSSVTATPTSSPNRGDRSNSRKNSEGSNRSKSPKFILPDMSASLQGTPSQAVYMSTTVPQNIKGQNIMGRHKPTRNSLRHSRLIVRNVQGASHSNSLNIKHVWLAKFVLLLKILIGICLVALGAWICLFANSTPLSQNPFWSGLIIIVSGLLGLYLLSFKRSRSKIKMNFFWFLKMNATVIIILSVFLTTLALIYATFHYVSITSDNKKCFPENIFINSSSCICVFNVRNEVVLSKEVASSHDSEGLMDTNGHIEIPDGGNVVHFRDLSCNELSTWTHILLTSMILNFVGLILAVCYLTQFIFGCKRRKKRNYLSVRNGV